MDLSRADLERPIERARDAGGLRRLADVVVAVVRQSMADDVFELSAALSYRFFMSIFPFGIFLAALGGYVASWLGVQNPAGQLVDAIGTSVPPEMSSLLRQELTTVMGNHSLGFLTFGAIAALFFASGGVSALMKATNQAYDVEEGRSIGRRYAIAIGLTFVGAIAVIVALVLFLTAQLFSSQIASFLGLGSLLGPLFAIVGWPLAFIFLFGATLILYRVAPNMALPWSRVAVGALVFSIAWLLATFGFALYLDHMANYGATFGALAGAVVLLVWLYITSIVLLVGAELNAVLDAIARPTVLQHQRAAAQHSRRDASAGSAGSEHDRSGTDEGTPPGR